VIRRAVDPSPLVDLGRLLSERAKRSEDDSRRENRGALDRGPAANPRELPAAAATGGSQVEALRVLTMVGPGT
jgi:hypothetical protein